MSDGYTTTNEWFAAFLMFLFGEECLTRVTSELGERDARSKYASTGNRYVKRFYCDVPSFDAQSYHEELKAGTLAISDLNAFATQYSRLNRILRDMRRDNEDSWCSPSWVAGRN